jgi:hypothetical protein
VCDCSISINYHLLGSFAPRSNPDRDYECHMHAVYDKGRCGFTLRVEAGRCGSNLLNTDIIRNYPKRFFAYRSHGIFRNWRGLRCGSMRVKPGRYGFDTVWTRFEIRLCVTVAFVWFFFPFFNLFHIWGEVVFLIIIIVFLFVCGHVNNKYNI